jgi:pyrroline-5-carboxylate reductase
MKLGVLGCGTIASAVVRGIAQDGHDIILSQRSSAVSAALSAEFGFPVAENQAVVDASDVIFLGLMAESAGDILSGLNFRPEQKIVSFMAGASLDQVAQMVAPASAAAVMIPFPGIAQGGSPILVLGDDGLIDTLFGARNQVVALSSDAELTACLAAQAVLSPAVRMVGDAAEWLGARMQDSTKGEAFLRSLVASSLQNANCADLIEALNTPGGYNQRLRLHMEDSGMRRDLVAGLEDLEKGI